MSNDSLNAGYVRINNAMINLIKALRYGNKEIIIKIAGNLSEDCDDLIETVYSIAGITEDDIVKQSSIDDTSLIKQAKWVPGDDEGSLNIPAPIQ